MTSCALNMHDAAKIGHLVRLAYGSCSIRSTDEQWEEPGAVHPERWRACMCLSGVYTHIEAATNRNKVTIS